MTKNVLRLGLVLAVCGAMMACNDKSERGQPQELPGEAAEAPEEGEPGQPQELP